MPGADEARPTRPAAGAPAAGSAPAQRTAPARGAEQAPDVPAPPSTALPKGGGAVRGIGETYSVNAATGTLTLSLPIFVSKARDLEPQLELRYESGAGNGPYGEGWALPLPSIDRRTD